MNDISKPKSKSKKSEATPAEASKAEVKLKKPLKQRANDLRKKSRHPFAVPIITASALLILTLVGFIVAKGTHKIPPARDAKVVILSYDNQKQIVPTKDSTVGELINKLNIKLGEGDVVEPAKTTKINQDQFRINIYRAVPVQIVDGSQKTFAFSAATTPRSIAQQSGTQLYPEDRAVTKPVDNFVDSGAIGEQVVVERATPVAVDLYGTPVTLRTHANTVAGLMREKGIKLEPKDQVVPAPNTPIAAGQKVSFIRTGSKTMTITEDIPMPTQNINDPNLAYGTTAIRQQGSPGQQIATYTVQLVNNVEQSRVLVNKVVTKQPVTQIAVVGSSLSGIKGDMALAGIAPSEYAAADYIISHESGWCPTKAQGQWGGCPPFSGYVPSGGGYGLCQATPGSKMASAGADWATNPVTQLRWCTGYAKSRYGGWNAAYAHWLSAHSW